jgi:hypothetical protein
MLVLNEINEKNEIPSMKKKHCSLFVLIKTIKVQNKILNWMYKKSSKLSDLFMLKIYLIAVRAIHLK